MPQPVPHSGRATPCGRGGTVPSMAPRPRKPLPALGWREFVDLPDLTASPIKAKVDTGARTSALHAFDLEIDERDGIVLATFDLHPTQRSARRSRTVSCEVVSFRKVRSSNGRSENRPVIRTPIRLGEKQWTIEVTLTSRDEMGFRMLLGRAAIKGKFLVNPGRSYLQSTKPSN